MWRTCGLARPMPTRENYPRTHKLTAAHTRFMRRGRRNPSRPPNAQRYRACYTSYKSRGVVKGTNNVTRRHHINMVFSHLPLHVRCSVFHENGRICDGRSGTGGGDTPPGKGWGGGMEVSKGNFSFFRSSWTIRDNKISKHGQTIVL